MLKKINFPGIEIAFYHRQQSTTSSFTCLKKAKHSKGCDAKPLAYVLAKKQRIR